MSKIVHTAYIIDDDEVYIYAIKRLIKLQNLCENILVFIDGKEAIDYIKENKTTLPDVILIDVNMPIMDGWEFLDAFQELKLNDIEKVDVYMVSSSIDPRDVKQAKQIPIIKEYIFKPITFEELKMIFKV